VNDRTPLHHAAVKERDDLVKLLLAGGAAVNARDRSGQTALHLAAYWGRESAVALLLAANADVNAKDNKGHTPLGAAQKHPQVSALLRRHGAR
jgi:uncharacterized protein